MRTLILVVPTVLLLAAAPGAVLADCRTEIGGQYVFVHAGVKPSGHAFSTIAFFIVKPGGTGGTADTFDVHATINERGVGAYTVDLLDRPFGWIDSCVVWWDRPGFIGYVSDDGAAIHFVTLDDEQMAGIATRTRR